MAHARAVPLPARALGDLKALFNPGTQAIPAGITGLRRQICQISVTIMVFISLTGGELGGRVTAVWRLGVTRPCCFCLLRSFLRLRVLPALGRTEHLTGLSDLRHFVWLLRYLSLALAGCSCAMSINI